MVVQPGILRHIPTSSLPKDSHTLLYDEESVGDGVNNLSISIFLFCIFKIYKIYRSIPGEIWIKVLDGITSTIRSSFRKYNFEHINS